MKIKKLYYIWLVIAFAMFIIVQNALFGIIFLVIMAMGISSVLIGKVLSKSIEITLEKKSDNVEVGQNMFFDIKSKNKSVFPTNKLYVNIKAKNLFLSQIDECILNIPVCIRGEEVVSSFAECNTVGKNYIEIKEAKISDYLGLVWFEVKVDEIIWFNVMPEEVGINFLHVESMAETDEDNDESIDTVDGYDIKSIREYNDGESLHRIHWKLSMKFDELMVKEFEAEVRKKFNILIDLSRDNLEYINDILEVANSLVSRLSKLGVQFSVIWYDNRCNNNYEFEYKNEEDKEKLYEELYVSGLGDKLGQVAYQYIDKYKTSEDAIVITAENKEIYGNVVGEYNKVVLMCM